VIPLGFADRIREFMSGDFDVMVQVVHDLNRSAGAMMLAYLEGDLPRMEKIVEEVGPRDVILGLTALALAAWDSPPRPATPDYLRERLAIAATLSIEELRRGWPQ